MSAKHLREIADLSHDPRNANKGTDRGRQVLKDSLASYGAGRSILTDRHGVTIAGNKTLERARELGLEILVVPTDGSKLVVVQREDLSLEHDQAARELAICDNRASELDLEWDPEVLADLEVDLGKFFTPEELVELGVTEAPAIGAGGDEFDAEPVDEGGPTRSAAGDVWQLGRHRMLVGDGRDAGDVARLMEGEEASLVVTDPPYGVAYVGGTNKRLTIANDDLGFFGTRDLVRDLLAAAPLRPGGVFYVCAPAGELETAFRLALIDCQLKLHQALVWVKSAFVLGHSDYHYQHETILFGRRPDVAAAEVLPLEGGPSAGEPEHQVILYGWRPGAGHYFVDDRSQSTVWEFPKPARNAEHPTMKPVALVERAINNSSRPGEIVYDCCAGSGTALVAAHRTGRRARLVEIDPRYADVVLARYTAETGEEPELVDRR